MGGWGGGGVGGLQTIGLTRDPAAAAASSAAVCVCGGGGGGEGVCVCVLFW